MTANISILTPKGSITDINKIDCWCAGWNSHRAGCQKLDGEDYITHRAGWEARESVVKSPLVKFPLAELADRHVEPDKPDT